MSGTVAIVPNGTANGHIDLSAAANGHANGGPSMRFTSGMILPPPEVKSIIDRTANFVARSANPPQFEDKIRENQRQDPKFSFLNPADPYHAYYRNRMDKVTKGELDEDVAMKDGKDGEGKVDGEGAGGEQGAEQGEGGVKKVEEDVGVEPPSPEFILELPSISAIDLDIMKLTALFTARRGRSFLQALSVKESRNYQFDFLKPTHSLFPVFNQLIEQYTKVLLPPPAKLEELRKRAQPGAKWEMLENARKYAKWEQKKRDQERKREDDREAERLAFAEIDWHDYAIVQTIEFTAADAASELPPPMSVQEVENMTLAQKRHAAMIMETTAEEVEAHRARQAEAEQNVANGVGGAGAEDGDAMMESDEEDAEDAELKERKRREEEERNREMERAKAIQASSLGAGGQMKIRTDYVAKVGQKSKVALTTCSICGQQIPVNELDEHMRIELLDPRWKSQRDALEARKAQASELQRGANVVSSLKNLARTRVDIFGGEDDEERRKREEEEENQKRKEREKVVWDGHTASKVTTMDKYATNSNIDEQIAAIHRAKLGLGPQEGTIGPGIGPAAAPPPLTGLPASSPLPAMSMPPSMSSLPSKPISADPSQSSNPTNITTTFPPAPLPNPNANPNPAYSAATISSGPQPPSMYPPQPAPVMLPPLHYQGLDAAQPFGYQPPPVRPVAPYAPSPVGVGAPGAPGQGSPMGMGVQPAIIGGATPGMQGPQSASVGMVRSADEMMEGGGGASVEDGGPAAKRQKVAKLPGGQLYPEQDWITMHPNPITIQVQIPSDKPELGLDGSLVTIPDLPLDLLVSTLRDRIMKSTNIGVGYSHIRLAHEGKMMSNQASIASYNLEEDDTVVLSVREPKKKK